MNDVAEAIERRNAVAELFLSLFDGRGHAEAETAAAVDFNLNHGLRLIPFSLL